MRSTKQATAAFMLAVAVSLVTPLLHVGAAEAATRPHDVAVHDGDIITTSLGTNSVTVLRDGSVSPLSVDVGAPSWGVCVADSIAYVTLPSATEIAVLDLGGTGTPSGLNSITVPKGCTEIISNAAGTILYVANVGASTAMSDSNQWQQSVLKINASDGSTIDTWATERQPRALALSPDEGRLFVGTVQGALGGAGIIATYEDATNGFTRPYDGGSIIVHETSTGSPTHRLGIGSPVRGLAILDDTDYSTSPSGEYRVYFTHVGEGVQSEDPGSGGQEIPNVVSSIRMAANHEPVSRQDTIFKHEPNAEPTATDTNGALPAVLPEKVVAVPSSSKPGYAGELWVTHSGSGTVGRAWIETDTGRIATAGTATLSTIFVDDVNPGTFAFTLQTKNQAFEQISPMDLVRTDDEPSAPFRSRPRGITYDPATGDVIVCTESFGTVVAFDATSDPLPQTANLGPPVIEGIRIADWEPGSDGPANSQGEGNFFTFGAGFDFREGPGSNEKVNNLTCGTCHVDGHIDGKVRLTVRMGDNMRAGAPDRRMVTAVPSMRDTDGTEWIFFEGLRTIVDQDPACSYCNVTSFFSSTDDFAEPMTTPATPYEPAMGAADASFQVGRAWFDDMNCARCHSAREDRFLRTHEDAFGDQKGPVLDFDGTLLSDPTQSFVSLLLPDPGAQADANSLRNMTVVHTRLADDTATIDPGGDSVIPGVNVPSLAGAWDAAPYLHDGRYRTLDEVLSHTWIQSGLDGRAAQVWSGPGIPDNLFDDPTLAAITSTSLPRLKKTSADELEFDGAIRIPKNFEVHAHADPDGASQDGYVSVRDYLTEKGVYQDFLLFLRSLSREIAPYGPGDPLVGNLAFALSSDSTAVVSWSTVHDAISRVEVSDGISTTVLDTIVGPGTSFTLPVDLPGQATWTAVVSTSYNGRTASDSQVVVNTPLFANRTADTGYNYDGNPYATIAFDFDGDGTSTTTDEDLLITDANGFAALMQTSDNDPLKNDVPLLTDVVGDSFPQGSPVANRGLASADFDDDGDLDLFLSSRQAPKVYRFDQFSDTFVDHTSALMDSFTAVADSSWCGAWGDYDRDGLLDLYIGRAGGSGDQASGALRDALLRNKGDGTFEDVGWETDLWSATYVTTTGVSWADANDDGHLDLFVGAAGDGEVSYLLRQELYLDTNDPIGTTDHDFIEDTGILPSSLDEIRGATWADLDRDGDLDLVLAGSGNGASGSRILWSADGQLQTTSTIGSGFAASGMSVSDVDLDGQSDVLLAPASPALAPGLFLNGGNQTFTDASSVSGMATVAATGFRAVLATDIAGPNDTPDGDPDIYLGRHQSTGAVFFQNKASGTDVSSNHWLKIKLESDNSNNKHGIGALVEVETDGGATHVQVVDGGSGVGSQSPRPLLFGLGATTSSATVRVTWPDASTDSLEVLSPGFDATYTITDGHDPGLRPSTIGAFAMGAPGGGADWVFQWETDYVCDPDSTKVSVNGGGGSRGLCPGYQDEVFDRSDPNVTVMMLSKPEGGYIHRVIVEDEFCGEICSYDYKVHTKTASGNGGWSGTKTLSTSACVN